MSEPWWSVWWRILPQLTCRSSLHSVQITIWGSVLSPTFYMSSPCVERGSSEWGVLHYRSGCSMKKVWGKHTAVTPAKGLSLFTAAPGSKRAMQPATPPGRGIVVNSQLCSLFEMSPNMFFWWISAVPLWILICWAIYTSCFPKGSTSSAQWSSTRCVHVLLAV